MENITINSDEFGFMPDVAPLEADSAVEPAKIYENDDPAEIIAMDMIRRYRTMVLEV